MRTACLTAFASLRGALLFTALASIAGAQTQTWIRQLGTGGLEYAKSTTTDGAGGVFMCGMTGGSLGGPNAGAYDAWIAHYDGAGNQSWIRQFGTVESDVAWAVAPDGAGGVFASGYTRGSLVGQSAGRNDAWLAHYDSAGNQTWIRQFGTTGGEFVTAAATDGAGGVFVSGRTEGSLGGPNAGGMDAWLARYDGAGNQTWIRQFGTSSLDRASAAAPDGVNGVFVSGSTYGSLGGPSAGGIDAWLARYDGAGNQTWIRQLGTPHDEYVGAAAPDGSGGAFVSGATGGSLGGPNAGRNDGWLAHYDSAGNQTWIRQFGTIDEDSAWGGAPDGTGGVFVNGITGGDLGGPNAGIDDAWLAHYDSAGSQTWIRQFGSAAVDEAHAAATDGAGGVFVNGITGGDLGGPNAGFYDAWLAHYDGLGAVRYCTPAVTNGTGQAGVVAATGSIFVADNNVTLSASRIPPGTFAFFLTSQNQGFIATPPNSVGNLCLNVPIGRYVSPGQILSTGSAGTVQLSIDLSMTPTPTGLVQVLAGETWNFQCWHRDSILGMTTSNFTDALSVTFH